MLAAALVVCIGGCGSSVGSSPPLGGESDLEMFPFESLSDWRNYADAVVEVEVAQSTRLSQAAPDEDAPDYILQRVKVVVTDVLWSRSPELPSEMSLDVPGWFRSSSGAISADAGSEFWGEGSTVVLAVVRNQRGYAGYSTGSVFRLDGGTIHTTTRSPAAKALDGLTVDQLAARVRATVPDPVSERYSDRPALERLARVKRAQAGLDPDGPLTPVASAAGDGSS